MEVINDTNSHIIGQTSDNIASIHNNIYSRFSIDRADDNLYNSFQDTDRIKGYDDNDDKKFSDINVNIYRYKFTNEFTEELFKFSKIHQYDHRKDFKEAWEIWMDKNEELIDGEVRRLTNLGYDGDIIDKMFKSARYYFRKKSTEKKAPVKRRIYVGSQKDLLDAMDEHIKSNINSEDFKPSDGL